MSRHTAILLLLLTMNGSWLWSASIVVSGQVTDNGIPANRKLLSLYVPGADTIAFTDSLGFYVSTVNPTTTSGIIIGEFIGACNDTVRVSQPFSPNTTQLRIDLHACPRGQLKVEGQIQNHQQAGQPIWVYLSLDQFRTYTDSALVDSTGYYSKRINVNSAGTIAAGIFDCNRRLVSDSLGFRPGDSINIALNYCLTSSNYHNGQILFRNRPPDPNHLHLLRYQYLPNDQAFTFKDTVQVGMNGDFQFPKDNEDYLIKAIPNDTGRGFAPTYFPSALNWSDDARSIGPHSTGQQTLNVIEIIRLSGSYAINGSVQVSSEMNIPGYRGAGITLLNEGGSPVDVQFADASNSFSFDNLPAGQYQIHLDQCGIPLNSPMITVGPTAPEVKDILIEVRKTQILVNAPLGLPDYTSSTLAAFPNPFDNKLEITYPSSVEIMIRDIYGNHLNRVTSSGPGNEVIDTSEWPPGFYFIESVDEKGSRAIHKLIKK